MPFYFYDGPPKNMIDIELLEAIIIERYSYILSIGNRTHDFKTNKDCIEEDHLFDKLSHYFLCLIACKCKELCESIQEGERHLFIQRLNVISSVKAGTTFKTILEYLEQKDIMERYDSRGMYKTTRNFMKVLINNSKHIFNDKHDEKCRKLKLLVPFSFSFKLLSTRYIDIHKGKAIVYCGKWKKLLHVVFDYMYSLELETIRNCKFTKYVLYDHEDDRVRQILFRFIRHFNSKSYINETSLTCNDIDNESQYFPPCMANLHHILKRTHRLSYESRYQYSLFLRDVGLSVDENIKFWEEEYTKPSEEGTCQHAWEEKKGRYQYQIKHMYGYIGCRVMKTSHKCDKFTSTLTLKMNGGCPFQHLSEDALRKSIPDRIYMLPDIEDLFLMKKKNEAQKCCSIYLKCQKKLLMCNSDNSSSDVNFNNTHHENIVISSPIQYYRMAKMITGSGKSYRSVSGEK